MGRFSQFGGRIMNSPVIQLDPVQLGRLSAARVPGAGIAILGVFLILLGSYVFFWQGRDWNSASRLMLVYAMGDQGTIRINGLENQTGDKASFEGRFYTDKQPGYSLLALPVYLLAKGTLSLEPHPLNRPGFAHWPSDYWVTLGTSGLLTAATGALLTRVAIWLGVSPVWAILPGIAYGLATPAFAYATLAYGHQTTSFLLLVAFLLIVQGASSHRPILWSFLAGLTSGYACTVELSVAPMVILYWVWLVLLAWKRVWPGGAPVAFLAGGVGPLLLLLGYNTLAYGSPFDMGYAHHTVPRFRELHSSKNPLGLSSPRWDLAGPLLWGQYRGLLAYAPLLLLAPLGWLNLRRRGRWSMAVVSAAACGLIFLVNLSYPEWTGGWSTGPRLLVPLLPFAMIGVIGALLDTGHSGLNRFLHGLAMLLALAGALVGLICVGVGARIPESLFNELLKDPITGVVWPLWCGTPIPGWWIGGRFARNLISCLWPGVAQDQVVAPVWQWLQFLPLVLAQGIGIGLTMGLTLRAMRKSPTEVVMQQAAA